jgi:type IV secretion system protein VirD4
VVIAVLSHFACSPLHLGEAQYNHVLKVSRTKARRELGNVLVVAPTRGGKGLLAESQLLTWQGSVIVNDIKGELFHDTAGYRKTLGEVFVIDPGAIGHQYNPLAGKESEDDLYTSAEYLLFEPHDGEGRVFTQRATKMLTQMFLAGIAEKQPLFLVLREMVNSGLEATAQRLYRVSPNLATKFLEVQYNHVDWENKFLVSAWETLSARLYPLLTENIVRCLSGSDFTPKSIIQSKKPVTVYLRWPEYKLHALSPLIKLIWATLINEMVYTYDSTRGENCYPVLLLIDETGRSAIPQLYEAASTVVGRHISLWVAIQSLSQLVAMYGWYNAETLLNNMDSQIFYRQASTTTAKELEESLGKKSEWAHSRTEHEGSESRGASEREVAVLTAQAIKKLHDWEIIGFHHNLYPFQARRMEWWRFSALKQRHAMTPPPLKELPSLPQGSTNTNRYPSTISSWHLDPKLFTWNRPTHSLGD